MSDYWLADADARVLGPIGLDVLKDLALAGKLAQVKAVSRDGQHFQPVSNFPEVAAALGPSTPQQRPNEQQVAVERLRNWLAEVQRQQPHEIFRVPQNASREAYRAAFFTLIRRFYPDRLAPDASIELRRACEDTFVYLTSRLLEVEQRVGAGAPKQTPQTSRPSEVTSIEWRGGSLDVHLRVSSHDMRFFTMHPEANFRSDSVYIESTETLAAGTPCNLHIQFEGHPSTIAAWGRVIRSDPSIGGVPRGFGVKLLDLSESDRTFIRKLTSI